jgi:hypothetical protein
VASARGKRQRVTIQMAMLKAVFNEIFVDKAIGLSAAFDDGARELMSRSLRKNPQIGSNSLH